MCPPKKLTAPPKKAQQAQKASKLSKGKNSKSKNPEPEEQPEVVEEEKPVVEEPPKKTTWLDTLKYTPPPDQELHIKLSKERQAKTKLKHEQICMKELQGILNYSLAVSQQTTDFKENNGFNEKLLQRKLRHLREDYQKGEYLPPEVQIETSRSTVVRREFKATILKSPDISCLLQTEPVDVYKSLINLMKATSSNEFTYDANPEMDSLLSQLSKMGKAFSDPDKLPDHVDLPFIICVTGPPCSGKTTISQFIHKFFKVTQINALNSDSVPDSGDPHVINVSSNDEKGILNAIQNVLDNSNDGILIANYPTTKNQLSGLEKFFAGYSKKSSKNANLNIIFRTSMTEEEAQEAIKERKLDTNSGFVYNTTFNPPNAIDIAQGAVLEDYPGDLSNYQKLLQSTSNMDNATKKGAIVIQIGKLDTVDKLYLQIENALRQCFDQNNVQPTFTTFVGLRDREQLEFAKQCFNIFNLWNSVCVTMFAQGLSEMFQRSKLIKEQTKYLANAALEKYAMILSQKDFRPEISVSLRGNSGYFDAIWNETIKERDERIKDIKTVLRRSGLEDLKTMLDNDSNLIYESILNRLYITSWFSREFGEVVSGKKVENIDKPTLPMFDNTDDFEEIANNFNLENFSSSKESKMDKFVDFLVYYKDNAKSNIERDDAVLGNKMFSYLIEAKEKIDSEINKELENMETTMKSWANKRYRNEMESFAEKYSHCDELPAGQPLFTFDKTFADGDVLKLIERLGYRFSPKLPLPIEEEKILNMVNAVKGTNVSCVTKFLEAADKANFTNEEKDYLECFIRWSTIPEFIDVNSFCMAFVPDSETSDKVSILLFKK
ncbi:hypothetical protein TVAG_092050 [Trichomonas vaginalis G3]|uniref:Uncharacterized protein n=1 Tax=Trichomonas vaginalis (strain ATCC PRA-98 / G3) TaxID=412133 RepID=A2FN70_TRIV3|nr:KPL2-related family [Trichomonas vaginalis G3]EAX93670.1 hypothetical protein TVAG_092050 [Trichomonas vaginalis G3]KAI5522832.1 KPL2-related family [Trichomonas vaginalis G3]|eukprot:XP_001306600.1 hypothetical protein [Trichomonas vaginalis G3]